VGFQLVTLKKSPIQSIRAHRHLGQKDNEDSSTPLPARSFASESNQARQLGKRLTSCGRDSNKAVVASAASLAVHGLVDKTAPLPALAQAQEQAQTRRLESTADSRQVTTLDIFLHQAV